MASTYCTHCGSEMQAGAAYCTACGAAMGAPPPQPESQQPAQPYPQQPQYPPQYAQRPPQYTPQYPQYPAQYPQYPPQYPPHKKSGVGRILAYIALGCAALLAIGVLAFVGIALLAPDGPGGGGQVVEWQATYDQKRVLDEFGPPQAFVVGYGEDHLEEATGEDTLPVHRVETWDYWDMQTRFEFKDGVAIGVTELPAPDFAVYTPVYSPLDFSLGMSPDDVAAFMQVGPSKSATLDQELLPGMAIDSFFDELYVSYQDGGLVGVESSLLSLEGGS